MGHRTINKTRGAALVVSLVLLTILSLLAVATMRTATLNLARAGNAQTMAQAFEAAQAGLAIAVARINDNALALVATDGWRHADAVTGTVDDTGQAFAVDLQFLYRGDPPPGFGPEPALYFELESTGRTRARNAASVQTQGFFTTTDGHRPVRLTYWFPHDLQ